MAIAFAANEAAREEKNGPVNCKRRGKEKIKVP
jgi:hypothetical protein